MPPPNPNFGGTASAIDNRSYDALTMVAAASVLIAGLVAGMLWIKFKPASNRASGEAIHPGPSIHSPDSTYEAPVRVASGFKEGTVLPPPVAAFQAGWKQGPALAPIPMVNPIYADSLSIGGSVEAGAQQSLSLFLDDYCRERAAIVNQAVAVKKTTWLPAGAGVVIQIDEGGKFCQGSAQYLPQSGWIWLTRPDA